MCVCDFRAAARCNKGIEVLLAVALEHFLLVVVRVLRGPTQADETAKKLRQLLHCQWCEERVFLKPGSMVEGKYSIGINKNYLIVLTKYNFTICTMYHLLIVEILA